jgi:hypothetical protein
MLMAYECIWGTAYKGSAGGGGERKGYCGVKRMEVHCMYTYEDTTVKPTKHCFKEGGKERGRMRI